MKNYFPSNFRCHLLINFVLIVHGSALSKHNISVRKLVCFTEDQRRFLVAGEGFHFAPSFHTQLQSTAASDTIMMSLFFTVKLVNDHKKKQDPCKLIPCAKNLLIPKLL